MIWSKVLVFEIDHMVLIGFFSVWMYPRRLICEIKSYSKGTFLQPEQQNLRIIILNERGPGTENVALTTKILSGSIVFS